MKKPVEILRLGLDVGSTTVKVAALDPGGQLVYQDYMRHYSDLYTSVERILSSARTALGDRTAAVACTGSGGLAVSGRLGIPFVQEVVAAARTVRALIPRTDVAIELGGEDAKITYFEGTVEQRMNGTCAGGTGAFIDQMATLMGTDAQGLNELAARHRVIYPVAARCGVFAKSDVQPLLNEGASREDIAASIFQAVVNQTIGGLACGRPIRGNVAFLGGPLSFLPELRKLFAQTLKLTPAQIIEPENGKLFVAMGCALLAEETSVVSLQALASGWAAARNRDGQGFTTPTLAPLFENEDELAAFRARHEKAAVRRRELAGYRGDCFLGVDAGSTTTKMALLSDDGALLTEYYALNHGNPLGVMAGFLRDLYARLPEGARIARSAVTGYGESLVQAAFGVDEGEVETVAHVRAAAHFDPQVDFLLDIGGQDMKCMFVDEGVITRVILNEACSSGCGSFIESLAESMGLSAGEFARTALGARHPMDLGTRCTVFMNSRIKQVQKEGADLADISAGLSYSVIKNALFKVIKLRGADALGGHVVVQGGTFLNDAVLRALEKITGREVTRPVIAGLMGAFGAALIARERYAPGMSTTLASARDADAFTVRMTHTRCRGCENACLLSINTFPGGRRHLSGNRCERGAGESRIRSTLPNIYQQKLTRLFTYAPLPRERALRGVVGLPRALNMYENYPFWFTFFTELGFRVELSGVSSKKIFEKGLESIPSESECYPARLVHGHIMDLIERGVDFIFYPCVPYEYKEQDKANNHYNCPIVATYAENIKNNVESVRDGSVRLLRPFVTLHDPGVLAGQLAGELGGMGVSRQEIAAAVRAAVREQRRFRDDIRRMGDEAMAGVVRGEYPGIVLVGRPYHIDEEIHHGIPGIVGQLGFAVFTEDSVSHMAPGYQPLRVLDQWMYHSRLYAAAHVAGRTAGLELVQLNSFGCGLDAITTDQVEEILKSYGKTYTLIKIDEVSNLGAARIRLRSLRAVVDERRRQAAPDAGPSRYHAFRPAVFGKHMTGYTVIAPQMSPIHFTLLEHSFRHSGITLTILPEVSRGAVETGLRYVNNDACYPAIIVIGQLMEALESGKYDLNRLAVMITQTGGSCRASNYMGLLRKALRDAGLAHIPAISLNTLGLEDHPGFRITPRFFMSAMMAVLYGDLFSRMVLRTRPYEKTPGAADALHRRWEQAAVRNLHDVSLLRFRRNTRAIIRDFEALDLRDVRRPRVGVVGEILVKYHPDGNNRLVELLESLGAEAVVPDLYDFVLCGVYNAVYRFRRMFPSRRGVLLNETILALLELLRRPIRRQLQKSRRFDPITPIAETARNAKPFLSIGNQSGEGWFLTGEMVSLIKEGVPNIVCTQPFACLPNHVVGKGTIRCLRDAYPHANIVPIDYDPGDTSVNQINRIELMLSIARERARAGGE